VKLRVGSLVKHRVVHRQEESVYRFGIAIREVEDNPFLVDCWRVAWIPTDQHPVGDVGSLYVDYVKKQNLVVLST